MYAPNEFGHEIFDRVKQVLYTFNVSFSDAELNDAIRKTIAQNPSELTESAVNRAVYHIVMYAFKRAGRQPDVEVVKQTIRTISQRQNPVNPAAVEESYRAALDRAQMGEVASNLERQELAEQYRREVSRDARRMNLLGCGGCIARLITVPGCLAMSLIYSVLTSGVGLFLLVNVVLPSLGQGAPPVDIPFLTQLGIDTSQLGDNIGGASTLFSAGMAGLSTILGAILYAARMLRSIIGLILFGLFIFGTGFIILFVMQTGIVDQLLAQAQQIF